jgi:hypothetical protein
MLLPLAPLPATRSQHPPRPCPALPSPRPPLPCRCAPPQCQSTALDKYRWWGTCTQALRYGFKQCSKDQANTWFKDEVNDRCNTAVAWIDQQASG